MKNLMTLTICLFVLACNEPNKSIKNEATTTSGQEQKVKTFIDGYIKAIESADWKTQILPYLAGDGHLFIPEHEKFRKAFSDYKIDVQHLFIEGNACVMWAKVKVKFVGAFDGNELKNTPPTGKNLEWTEIWYFDVVNNKFTNNFDFADDGISRMKQVGIKCLPQ